MKTLAGSKVIVKLPNFDARRKFDIEEALHLRTDHGLSYQEIANQFGTVTKQAVHHALKPLLENAEELDSFKKNRSDIFASKQLRIMKLIDDEMIKNAKLGDINNLFGTLYDKERLERGLSTSNQAVIYASAVERAFAGAKKMPQEATNSPQDVVIEAEIDVK